MSRDALINAEPSKEMDKVKVKGKVSPAKFHADGEYFLVYAPLKREKVFALYKYENKQTEYNFACRNFILKYKETELTFRVYFRFAAKNQEFHPVGVLSFEGESKPRSFLQYKNLWVDSVPGNLVTNFGMNENGFRHLVAYCRSVFGVRYNIFTNEKTLFYQSPLLYRKPPLYVWHIIELIKNQEKILLQINEQQQKCTHFFEKFIDKVELAIFQK